MIRFAVLASGEGTNLQALIDFWRAAPTDDPTGESELAVVIANRPGAHALSRARAAGIPAELIDHRAHRSREAFEAALVRALERHDVRWIVLAGFMRILTPAFIARYRGHIINTHPALLPAFPGKDAAAQAVAHGVKVSGCTFHFVDEKVDAGPIIAQAAVPVLAADTAETLAARIQQMEHRLYPKIIARVLAGRAHVVGRVVHLEGGGR